MPMPTIAGRTEAAKNATAQIARLRIRWLVPSGGVQPAARRRRVIVSP